MTPIDPVTVPGLADDVVARGGDVITAGRCGAAERSDERLLFFGAENPLEDFLSRRHRAARGVDAHHDRLDPRHLAKAPHLGEHGLRIVDGAFDLQYRDAIAGKQRQRLGVAAGDVRVEKHAGKDHQDKNQKHAEAAQDGKFSCHDNPDEP